MPQKFLVTPATRQEWLYTGTWAFYFAIFGFVLSGLYAIALGFSLVFIAKSSAVAALYLGIMPSSVKLGIVLLLLLYVASIFVLFIGSRHQLRFAQNLKRALKHNNQLVLEESWKRMRKAWKTYGIYTVVMLSVYFIVLTCIGYMIQNNPFMLGY